MNDQVNNHIGDALQPDIDGALSNRSEDDIDFLRVGGAARGPNVDINARQRLANIRAQVQEEQARRDDIRFAGLAHFN